MSKIIKLEYNFDNDEELKEHLKYMDAGTGYEDLMIDLKNRIEQARKSDCDKKEAIDHIADLVENDKYGYNDE